MDYCCKEFAEQATKAQDSPVAQFEKDSSGTWNIHGCTREWGRRGSQWDYNNNPELVKKARGPAYKPVNPLRFSWERVL